MRPITNFTLHAALAAVLAAFAATGAAAQSPPTLRIETETPSPTAAGHKDHKGEIEILSYSWGTTSQGHYGGGAGAGKVQMAAQGEKGGTEDINIGVGELQEAKKKGNVEYSWKVEEGEKAPPAPGGVQVAAGDVTGDGSTEAPRKPTIGRATLTPKSLPGTGGSASGLPTGKRQHKPFTLTKPLDKGSVWVRVASPWAGCKVGARYPSLELSSGSERHVLQDVTVSDCGGGGGTSAGPEESITFVYGKLVVK